MSPQIDPVAAFDPPLVPYLPVLGAAMATVFAATLAIGGWAMAARLDAAIVTVGVLHADSERKTVEHLESGTLAEVLVRPGDKVVAGEVVARLDATQVREQLVQLGSELRTRLLDLWRLAAERDGVAPDPGTAPGNDAGISGADGSRYLAEALDLASARARAHGAQITSLERQIAEREGQITANTGQARSAETQLQLWTNEHDLVGKLVERGAAPRQRLLELERAMAAMAGDRDENNGLILAARQDIARARADIEALKEGRQAEIAAQMAEARSALVVIESQIRAAQDVLERRLLRAPQAGRVVDISTVTPGAVLVSGQSLMDILPGDDRLVALLRLPPASIESVKVGGEARVRLIAYKRVEAPVVAGEVSYVSADLLEDPLTGETYFETRVALDPKEVADLKDAQLMAGMPVEVTIVIGERRAGDYLLEPILRHFRRALREE